MFKKLAIFGATAALALGAVSYADSIEGPFAGAIKARHGQMNLYALNMGVLGAMAKGEAEYDADAAAGAAANILALSQLDASAMWPAGSDNFSSDGTRALPAIWENFPDIAQKAADLTAAAEAMNGAAGESLEALQAAMPAMGAACGGCHRAYREPN